MLVLRGADIQRASAAFLADGMSEWILGLTVEGCCGRI